MIRAIIDWSLQFRLLIVIVSAVVVFFGAAQLRDMPVDVYPEFAPVTVEVRSEALGLSAQEVAELITAPLEANLLSQVPWVDIIRSESVPGLSSVELIFEPGTDLLRARQMVEERIAKATVLGASKPPEMLQPRSSTSRVMMVGLSSSNLSLIDLSVLARWNIRPRLMGVPGVANVAIWGMREQQLQVQVDPARLEAEGIPLIDIVESTANALWSSPLSFVEAAVPGTGGFIDTPNQRLNVQHISPITTAEDLAQVTIEGRAGLRLSDVASVVEDHQPLIGNAILRDGPGLLLVIDKWPEANALEVTHALDEALAAMAPGLAGVEIDANIYRPASYVDEAIDNLTLLLIIAAIIILMVLVAFLFDLRMAVIGAVTISLSLLVSAIVLDLIGESMNHMALCGLVAALVLLIDDAVIGANGLWRKLRERREATDSMAAAIRDGLAEEQGPMLFALLIVLAGLIPFFVLAGIWGEFFPAIGLAFAVATITSTVLALTLAPALALILMPGQPRRLQEPRLAVALRAAYEKALASVLAAPRPAFAIAAIAVLVGAGLSTQLGEESLLPAVKERHLLIRWDGAPGTSQPAMTRILAQAAAEIEATPGVRDVGAHVGRAITSDQVVGINSAEIWVSISANADYDATVAAIQGIVDGYPGFDGDLLTYTEERVAHILGGSDKDLVVRVYGEDTSSLRARAEAVRGALAGIEGVVDPVLELPNEEPTIEIQVDLDAAQRFGLKPGDVRRSAATLLNGLLVGNLFEEQKVFEVVVWSTPETRNSVDAVGNLLIDSPTGAFVRLDEVADVRLTPNLAVVQRESVSRYLDVSANVSGRSLGAVEAEIDQRIKELQFPLGHHAEVVTDKASGFREMQQGLLPYAITSVAGIFLLLQAAFRSWRLSALALVLLPGALVGGVIAAIIAGGELTIGSYIGFIVILAISVRATIALISALQALDSDRPGALDAALILRGAGDRVLPVVMTALAGGLALAPIIFAGSAPGLEVIQPAAVVILGGLVTSTLLTLFLLPALCLRFWTSSEPEEAVA
jgi:CzcA family heavy metal efflux pump